MNKHNQRHSNKSNTMTALPWSMTGIALQSKYNNSDSNIIRNHHKQHPTSRPTQSWWANSLLLAELRREMAVRMSDCLHLNWQESKAGPRGWRLLMKRLSAVRQGGICPLHHLSVTQSRQAAPGDTYHFAACIHYFRQSILGNRYLDCHTDRRQNMIKLILCRIYERAIGDLSAWNLASFHMMTSVTNHFSITFKSEIVSWSAFSLKASYSACER